MRKVTGRVLALACVLAGVRAYAQEGRTGVPFITPVATPITIAVPGMYTLTQNITANGPGPVITIAPGAPGPAPHIAIDLNGFILSNAPNPGSPVISIPGPAPAEVVIKNGTLIGGLDAIVAPAGVTKIVIENVHISGAAANGIHLTSPQNFVIRNSVISGLTGGAGILIDSVVSPANWQGTIEGNQIQNSANGITVTGAVATHGSVVISRNQLNGITATPPFPGAIRLINAEPCIVSENTIENVTGTGIFGMDLEGCKLINNVMSDIGAVGISLDALCQDNFLIHNIVRGAFGDGLFLAGARNHIDQNILNANGAGGGLGFGLHIGPVASGNRIGRNSAIGNSGNPGIVCAAPTNVNYCDESGPLGTNTVSFGDNLMPGPSPF